MANMRAFSIKKVAVFLDKNTIKSVDFLVILKVLFKTEMQFVKMKTGKNNIRLK